MVDHFLIYLTSILIFEQCIKSGRVIAIRETSC